MYTLLLPRLRIDWHCKPHRLQAFWKIRWNRFGRRGWGRVRRRRRVSVRVLIFGFAGLTSFNEGSYRQPRRLNRQWARISEMAFLSTHEAAAAWGAAIGIHLHRYHVRLPARLRLRKDWWDGDGS